MQSGVKGGEGEAGDGGGWIQGGGTLVGWSGETLQRPESLVLDAIRGGREQRQRQLQF